MSRKVTSFDVAKLAGVSQPTVSRALRNLPGATPETRRRVRDAAERLGYVPSDSGRALSTQQTRRVAVVSEQLTNPFYPELVEPLSRYLENYGLRSVVVTHDARGGVEAESLADGSFDGVILTTVERRSSLPSDLAQRGIPHVLANRILDRLESHSCAADNAGGARAVSALISGLGHTRVASIQGLTITSTGRERAEGLRDGMAAQGLRLLRELTRRVPFSHEGGMTAAHDLLIERHRPTAIVCGNDVIALGALSAARKLGIRVPEQLTVVGFDDIALAGWPLVNLTTVRCDLDELARTAVELLISAMTTPDQRPQLQRLPVEIILRGTHGGPSY